MSSSKSPVPSTPSNGTSKLPKFLQKQHRDSSKSLTHPTQPNSTSKSSIRGPRKSIKQVDPPPLPPPPPMAANAGEDEDDDDPPVIIEPVAIPRARTRSERPISSVSDGHPSAASLYASTASTSTTSSNSNRIGDLPTRLSGWFSHTFSTSSTDLSLPTLSLPSLPSPPQPSSSQSPKSKQNSLITAARNSKSHIDKAVRYILDSDSTPDKNPSPIWLLGMQHQGYEPPPPPPPPSASPPPPPSSFHRRDSFSSYSRRSFRSSLTDLAQTVRPSSSNSNINSGNGSSLLVGGHYPKNHPGNNWPPVFYTDFTSRVWLTYRTQFSPIRDITLSALEDDASSSTSSTSNNTGTSPLMPKKWNWSGGTVIAGPGWEKGWTSDAGWGCMLRTGQSLLANALLHLHLGRDWRRPPHPIPTTDYATYVQILTWFFDSPSPLAPFSVHRMALAGKELGKDVGMWFGPSTAAGAIKTLTTAYPDAGLGVSVATDGAVYQSDVFAASHVGVSRHQHHHRHPHGKAPATRTGEWGWGGRAVLVLVGIRLGLDCVNPVYYETIKTLYTFPQSVGIAGGRPSSSYYFVGSQADNLFYLDPHHPRPTIPLRPQPSSSSSPHSHIQRQSSHSPTPHSHSPTRHIHERQETEPSLRKSSSSKKHARASASPPTPSKASPINRNNNPTSYTNHSPKSPSPLSSTSTSSSPSSHPPSSPHTPTHRVPSSVPSSLSSSSLCTSGLDEAQAHLVGAYTGAELRTFHCERVRKMPLSGLDPSMLIGFLCKDEEDWKDLRGRVHELSTNPKTKSIFVIQDEPPSWPSGEDGESMMGLESMSEPDDMEFPMDEDEVDGDGEEKGSENFFDSPEPDGRGGEDESRDGLVVVDKEEEEADVEERKSSSSSSSLSFVEGKAKGEGRRSSSISSSVGRDPDRDLDTEEDSDPMGPVTPGPMRASFEAVGSGNGKGRVRVSECGDGDDDQREEQAGAGGLGLGEDEDDWVDSSMSPLTPVQSIQPQPQPQQQQRHRSSPPAEIAPLSKGKSNGASSGNEKKSKKKSKRDRSATAPPPSSCSTPQSFPFPRSTEDNTSSPPPQLLSFPQSPPHVEKAKRMHTARARDGGRTQSGGVKGVLTEGDF